MSAAQEHAAPAAAAVAAAAAAMADSDGPPIGGALAPPPPPLPRITIRFCTQCKWMLRAAYYAQELLSTFSTSLGEVALQPSTGGTFVVAIEHGREPPQLAGTSATGGSRIIWDRKTDGGFPETKELKRRVRDVIDPGRNLGHVDRVYPTGGVGSGDSEGRRREEDLRPSQSAPDGNAAAGPCEDCK